MESNTHLITLEVTYRMEEMEGTSYQSAGIALELIWETLNKTLAGDVFVKVTDWDEVDEDSSTDKDSK